MADLQNSRSFVNDQGWETIYNDHFKPTACSDKRYYSHQVSALSLSCRLVS